MQATTVPNNPPSSPDRPDSDEPAPEGHHSVPTSPRLRLLHTLLGSLRAIAEPVDESAALIVDDPGDLFGDFF